MHAIRIVARVLESVQVLMHVSRWWALHDVAFAAVGGAALSVTGLALRTARPTALRQWVKCVDRLLGNTHFSSYCQKRNDRLAARSALPPSSAFSSSALVRPAGSSFGATDVAIIVMT